MFGVFQLRVLVLQRFAVSKGIGESLYLLWLQTPNEHPVLGNIGKRRQWSRIDSPLEHQNNFGE